MGYLDSYYKAFDKYRKVTESKKECTKLRDAIKNANAKNDIMEAVKLNCIIDEEWVSNVEEGLKYVEKAVQEDRQFIRTEGEVVPIEKAKRTSKDSVSHLARHSGLITHLPEDGKTIIPDKIYMVEKLSDYAVYENRFLYMMLCYLRDFISMRIDKIRDQMTTYRANLLMNKDIYIDKRHMMYNVKLFDEIKGDEYLYEEYKSDPVVKRIEECYSMVLALLNTPLMESVSKSPMLKPPIIKTNTLKMNPNFKASLALYEYISSYNKDGYTFSEDLIVINPFTNEIGDEMGEVVSLTSFFTYQGVNKLRNQLKNNLLKEEEKENEIAKKEFRDQVLRLKRRLNEKGTGFEEYILALEQDNRLLKKDSEELITVREELDKLKIEVDNLNKQLNLINVDLLNNEKLIHSKEEEIFKLNDKYVRDLSKLDEYYRATINKLERENIDEVKHLNETHNKEKEALNNNYEQVRNQLYESISLLQDDKLKLLSNYDEIKGEMSNLKNRYDKKLLTAQDDINIKLEEQIASDNKKMDALINEYEYKMNKIIEECDEKISKQNKAFEKERKDYEFKLHNKDEEKYFVKAQLHMKRLELGLTTFEEDYSSKERFEELEKEYQAFNKLFKKQWRNARRKIRKNILNKVTKESVLKQEKEDNDDED